MFCSNCGNELRQGLKYCNRCGAITATELEKSVTSSASDQLAQTLSIAIGWIGVAGVVALAILIANLLRQDDIKPPAFLLMLVFGAMVFGIIYLLVRQISVLSGKAFLPSVIDNFSPPRESLPHTGNTAQLEAPREPVSSVTDHTTRIFEENFVPKSKN